MKSILATLLLTLALTNTAFSQDKEQQLQAAISEQKVEKVAQLLKDGADANFIITMGAFKLSLLSMTINTNHNIEIVKLLLDNKADVNWKDAFNTTPLMYAASTGNIEIAELLIKHGADVAADDGKGISVLAAAKESKNKRMIRLIENRLKEKAKN